MHGIVLRVACRPARLEAMLTAAPRFLGLCVGFVDVSVGPAFRGSLQACCNAKEEPFRQLVLVGRGYSLGFLGTVVCRCPCLYGSSRPRCVVNSGSGRGQRTRSRSSSAWAHSVRSGWSRGHTHERGLVGPHWRRGVQKLHKHDMHKRPGRLDSHSVGSTRGILCSSAVRGCRKCWGLRIRGQGHVWDRGARDPRRGAWRRWRGFGLGGTGWCSHGWTSRGHSCFVSRLERGLSTLCGLSISLDPCVCRADCRRRWT